MVHRKVSDMLVASVVLGAAAVGFCAVLSGPVCATTNWCPIRSAGGLTARAPIWSPVRSAGESTVA
jgi:hypothetical protein